MTVWMIAHAPVVMWIVQLHQQTHIVWLERAGLSAILMMIAQQLIATRLMGVLAVIIMIMMMLRMIALEIVHARQILAAAQQSMKMTQDAQSARLMMIATIWIMIIAMEIL